MHPELSSKALINFFLQKVTDNQKQTFQWYHESSLFTNSGGEGFIKVMLMAANLTNQLCVVTYWLVNRWYPDLNVNGQGPERCMQVLMLGAQVFTFTKFPGLQVSETSIKTTQWRDLFIDIQVWKPICFNYAIDHFHISHKATWSEANIWVVLIGNSSSHSSLLVSGLELLCLAAILYLNETRVTRVVGSCAVDDKSNFT